MTEIIPEYIVSEREDIKALLRRQLGFLGKTRLNHVLRCLDKPKNGLFNALLPHLYDAEEQTYLGVFERVETPGRNHILAEALAGQPNPAGYQEQAQYFCNSLKVPEFFGMKKVRKKGRETEQEDWRPAPSARVVNLGSYVYTIEIDPPHANVQEFLDNQIGWCLSGRAAGQETSCLDRLYEDLSQFRDFRLLELIWSGNKSCHLNCLFDIRHLASTRFVGSRRLAAAASVPDIDDALLRPGLQELWQTLVDLVSPFLGIGIKPDPMLAFPETMRRLPWGRRLVTPKDLLGFPVGSQVPQVVLYSRGRGYSRAGTKFFNDPAAFLSAARPKRIRKPRTVPTKQLSHEHADAFVEDLGELCERLWGDPETKPRPSELLDDPEGFKVAFYNHAGDRNPSSVMKGDFRTLLVQGRVGPNMCSHYALPMSINDLVGYWQANGHLVPEQITTASQSWLEEGYLDRIEESPGSERVYLPRTAFFAAKHSRLSAILTQEGVGKTTALLSSIPREADPEGGPLVFASASYRQAEEKCVEFNSDPALHRGIWHGVLMPSVHHACTRARRGKASLTPHEILSLGCSSLIEAVYTQGGPLAEEVERQREEFLTEYDQRGRVPIIFTVHGVVQEWYRHGGTRLWLHPRFHKYLALRRSRDYAGASELAKELHEQQRFQWVIYDEISTGDLMSCHPESEVRWVWNFIAGLGRDWEEMSFGEKVREFDRALDQNPHWTMSLERCREIIDADYEPSDIKAVDPTLERFGVNNSPDSPYLTVVGHRFVTKTRDWWIRNRFKLTVLTTERKPLAILRAIREEALRASEADPETQAKRAEFDLAKASLGPDDPTPTLELPLYDDVFSIVNLDTSDLMLENQRSAKLVLTSKARVGPNVADPDIVKLCEEIRNREPDTVIVSDRVRDDDVSGVITHKTARGSNEFAGKALAAVLMHLAPDQYRDLLLENAQFGIRNAVKLHYLDVLDQSLGRTLGFRHGPGSDATVYMSERLWKQIGMTLLTQSRYQIVF